MPGDVYRCIGYVKMYYIRGRTKPEDKFVLRHESSRELSCLAPSEIYNRGLKVINLWITNEGRTVRCRDCAIDRLPQYDLNGCCTSTVPPLLISGYSKSDKVFTLITVGGNESATEIKQELEEYVVTREILKHMRTLYTNYGKSW